MDQLCLDPQEMFDDHFILVYPWWLRNEGITNSPGPLETQTLRFIGSVQVRL